MQIRKGFGFIKVSQVRLLLTRGLWGLCRFEGPASHMGPTLCRFYGLVTSYVTNQPEQFITTRQKQMHSAIYSMCSWTRSALLTTKWYNLISILLQTVALSGSSFLSSSRSFDASSPSIVCNKIGSTILSVQVADRRHSKIVCLQFRILRQKLMESFTRNANRLTNPALRFDSSASSLWIYMTVGCGTYCLLLIDTGLIAGYNWISGSACSSLYPCRLCRSAWVEFSSSFVCLSVCLSVCLYVSWLSAA